MTAYLDQIDRLNPAVNAVVSRVETDTLLDAADASDAELAKGRYHGPMHGMPHAVKDIAATKGMLTTSGAPVFADLVPAHDAFMVERMRGAGALFIGKTNVPEFGLGSHTRNPIFGTTLNAYDQTKSAGGSSGGAAVALALHMVPLADGSDFGGSLRNPAGWNNVYGFRPSAGRVPMGPLQDVFMQQLGYEGPMARNVTDLAMLLSVIAGYDDRAPLSLEGDPLRFAAPLERDMRGVRIAWLGNLGGIPMEDGMLELCLGGIRRLEQAGCIIEEATLGVDRETIWTTFVTLRNALLAGSLGPLYADPGKRALLKPEAVWEIERGLKLSAVDFYKASMTRTQVYQAYRELFEIYDFVAMPSAQLSPFDATLQWPEEIAGVSMDSYHRWMEIVTGPTLSGCPTICVPAGFNDQGLSNGIQIMGPPRKDLSVLQIARAYEQVSASALTRLPDLLG